MHDLTDFLRGFNYLFFLIHKLLGFLYISKSKIIYFDVKLTLFFNSEYNETHFYTNFDFSWLIGDLLIFFFFFAKFIFTWKLHLIFLYSEYISAGIQSCVTINITVTYFFTDWDHRSGSKKDQVQDFKFKFYYMHFVAL